MPTYLAYKVTSNGHIEGPLVEVLQDEDAGVFVEAANWALQPHAIEVWCGDRYVAEIPAAAALCEANLLALIKESARLRAQICPQ